MLLRAAVSEIANLRLDDARVEDARPQIVIRASLAKSRRLRRVPLWWDQRTLEVLVDWKLRRVAQGATGNDRFIASTIQLATNWTDPVETFLSGSLTAGAADRQLFPVAGAFVSLTLAAGLLLRDVRGAAETKNFCTTSSYAHVLVDGPAG